MVTKLGVTAFEGQPPVKLVGEFIIPLVPDGLSVSGHAAATPSPSQELMFVDAELEWQENSGQLIATARGNADPLSDLPWEITRQQLAISDGCWNWPCQEFPLNGRLGMEVENWQAGLEDAVVGGRLNVLTYGDAGKGNAILTLGSGKLGMDNSEISLRLTGETKQGDLIFYTKLPARSSGGLNDPQLALEPEALLRSRGRVTDSSNIDEIRWPLAGVKVTQRGVGGRLQVILRTHENQMGGSELRLGDLISDFLLDAGRQQWQYWGRGSFTPIHARWDMAGKGKWYDNTLKLFDLSTGFDHLQYDTIKVGNLRLVMDEPIVRVRDATKPRSSGALSPDTGNATLTEGSVLPPSTLKFSVEDSDPIILRFRGQLHAGAIGPVQLSGRWDGIHLRKQVWWPKQSLTVF